MREALGRRWALVPAVAALLFQLSVIYAPSGVGAPPFPQFDKLVHATVFAVPVFFALLARLPFWPVVAVMAVHAPVSEVIQALLLPNRSGDPWDAVADLAGVGLGVLLFRWLSVRNPGRVLDQPSGR